MTDLDYLQNTLIGVETDNRGSSSNPGFLFIIAFTKVI
jgi:hypothetical protein